jgi:hypothetical protein
VGAVRDQSVAHVVLSQQILHSLALALARGDRDDSTPSVQLEAIRYLDACLNRNRTIKIEGLTLKLDASEAHVAAIAFAALEAEAKGTLGAEDARHLIESAAMVQQIMHGKTIAADMTGTSRPSTMQIANGHVTNGNGSATVTSPDPSVQPIRPKWLKTPEAIAAAAAQRAAKKMGEK